MLRNAIVPEHSEQPEPVASRRDAHEAGSSDIVVRGRGVSYRVNGVELNQRGRDADIVAGVLSGAEPIPDDAFDASSDAYIYLGTFTYRHKDLFYLDPNLDPTNQYVEIGHTQFSPPKSTGDVDYSPAHRQRNRLTATHQVGSDVQNDRIAEDLRGANELDPITFIHRKIKQLVRVRLLLCGDRRSPIRLAGAAGDASERFISHSLQGVAALSGLRHSAPGFAYSASSRRGFRYRQGRSSHRRSPM